MKRDSKDWIVWFGGPCPVPPESFLDVVTISGQESTGFASSFDWIHDNSPGTNATDIIAYKFHESGNPTGGRLRPAHYASQILSLLKLLMIHSLEGLSIKDIMSKSSSYGNKTAITNKLNILLEANIISYYDVPKSYENQGGFPVRYYVPLIDWNQDED